MISSDLLHLWPDLRSVLAELPRPRNGKVARLPSETREAINQMLDQRLPYRVILERLGPAGRQLNLQNLCNWKKGGYLDSRLHKARSVIIHAALGGDEPGISQIVPDDTKPRQTAATKGEN